MKKILITGAAGFLGQASVQYFSERGWSVIGVDASLNKGIYTGQMIAYHTMRLPDPFFPTLVQQHRPDLCIHCAGRASVPASVLQPQDDFYAGPALTFEVLNALRLYAPECKLVYLSSAAVYGNPLHLPVTEDEPLAPISPYGYHKWQGELLCQEFQRIYGLPTTALRIFSAYGPGLKRQVVWDIYQKALTGKQLELQGTGKESRDFIHAVDVARAIDVLYQTAAMRAEVYNLGTGREVTIQELAGLILSEMGRDVPITFNGVVPPGTPLYWRADITKLKNLGFEPAIHIEDGVRSILEWRHLQSEVR